MKPDRDPWEPFVWAICALGMGLIVLLLTVGGGR